MPITYQGIVNDNGISAYQMHIAKQSTFESDTSKV
jgi:hypothetical protein